MSRSTGGYRPNDRGIQRQAPQAGGRPSGGAPSAQQPSRAPGRRPVYTHPGFDGRIRSFGSANTGLLYDRMADIWSNGNAKLDNRQQDGFLKDIAQQARGAERETQPLLAGLHARRAALWQARGAAEVRVTPAAPLVSGLGMSHALEVGFSWDRNLGVPFLPGSSLKGAARAYAEQWLVAATAKDSPERQALQDEFVRLFGARGAAPDSGCVIIHALYPETPPTLRLDVLNPHFSPYYLEGEAPGDWHAPRPVYFLTAAPGPHWRTAVQPTVRAAEGDAARAAKILAEALTMTGVGGKTALGYGVFAEAR